MNRLKQYLLPLAIGIVGASSFYVVLHTYQDHQSLHGLISIEIQRQQNATKSQPTNESGEKK